MAAAPFLVPVPKRFADDPELAPYFNLLQKVLHDLTVIRGTAIASPTADLASLKTAVDSLIAQMESDGTIET